MSKNKLFLRLAGGLFLALAAMARAWAQGAIVMGMALSSPAFGNDDTIPDQYTCLGNNVSPPLYWTGVPAGTRSLVLVVEDPDAGDPAAPGSWVHWLLYNIPPSATSLPEGVSSRDLPVGTELGVNDWKRSRYGGPCPAAGEHRYAHRLFALDTTLVDMAPATWNSVVQAMRGHVLGEAQLVGTFARP